MKILVINDLVVGGGVENVMHQLVQHLYKKNAVTVLSIFKQTKEFKRLYPSEVKYYSYFLKTYPSGKYRRWSLKWIKRKVEERLPFWGLRFKKYDVVLALKEGDAMKLGLKFKAEKKYAWVHADYRQIYWTKYCFDNAKAEVECMRKYDKVVCVSNAAKESVCQVIGDPGNLCVRFNPIDVKTIKEQSGEELQVLDEYLKTRKADRPILVTVGRLCEQKGYGRLLDACIKLNKEFDYELWILGEGEQRQEIENLILENGLDNIVLWGNQENPFPFIERANWFVSATLGESYGLALQEALTIGTPVLATSCPAFEECLSEGEAILVSNTGEALYEGMHRVLKDRSLEATYRQRIESRTQEVMFSERLREIENLWRAEL